MKPPVIFIVGPTSSGKSLVAVHLAMRINGEIVSCDSMQVYKDMNVVTQVPQKDLLSCIPHHLIRVIPPEKEFGVMQFVKEARKLIDLIISKGKIPIIAGGTGLYIKALIDGIFPSLPKDESFRGNLHKIASEKGNKFLYNWLMKIDPDSADRLHPNDIRRVIRALEVYKQTGKTISKKKTESKGIFRKYDCKMFGLKIPRELLYARINSTVEKMFEEGLVDEVRQLIKRKLGLTAEKALGIKEVSALLNGEMDLESTKEELKKNTRKYAKRQLTWFRADKRIIWLNATRDAEFVVKDIVKRIKN